MLNRELRILNSALFVLLISGLFVFLFSLPVSAESTDSIRIIKISPQDGRAVVKTSGRKLRIIKVGDVVRVAGSGFRVAGEKPKERDIEGAGRHVPGAGVKRQVRRSALRVVEIAADRVVFEEMTDAGPETVIIRVEEDSSGLKKQRVERIRKTFDKQPLLYKPK